MNNTPNKVPPAILWWIIWFAITGGLTIVYFVLGHPPSQPPDESLKYLPVGPLFISCVIRWFVLPRFSGTRALPVFMIGLVLAEASGLLGIFIVPSMKEDYFILSLLGLVQFFPLFIPSAKTTSKY
jgi:hypothetical protein